MIVNIDKNLKPVESRLFLCKPNRETIAELKEAYGKKIKHASSGIDELSFILPYKVMRHNKYVRNKNINNIKGHYLIRYEAGNYKAYFIINKPVNTSENGIDVKEVSCFLLPYELDKKIIRNYKETKRLYDRIGSDGILNDTLLRRTDWSVDYIDADIALKYRTFDISEMSLLEFMHELRESFDAIILWNTIDKKISFHKPENVGQNKGLYIENGKYLKTINEEPDFDNVVTRLRVYGNNGISINKYNPAGTDYVESFAYYMYPFERDENREVISHSTYMSDALCHAILDYQGLLVTKESEFKVLLDNQDVKEASLLQRQNELFTLQTELAIIEDQLAVANATDGSTSTLITQKNQKIAQINNKNNEINTVNNEIATINNQISVIKNEIAIENNFTPSLIIERDKFIHERTWSNEHYFDEKELYTEGVRQLGKVNQPIISYNIDIVDFLKVVQCKNDWNKLNKYDIVTIKYPEFNINIKAKIIEIDRDEDNNAIHLTIANADDIKNGFIQYKDLLQKFSSSSTRVDMSKYKWDMSEENVNKINDLINNEHDATKRKIVAGVNESVEISRKGIIITNPDNPMEMLIGQSGVLALSGDGGNTWKVAIKPTHIVADLIMGKLIAGTNLTIDASDSSGQKTFTVDATGVKIKGSALIIEDGLSPDQLDPTFKDSLVELNKSYTNGVRIDTSEGLVITRSDNRVKSTFNATEGIRMQRNTGTVNNPNWVNTFHTDTNGNIHLTGNITMTGGNISWDNIGKPTYTSNEIDAFGALPKTWVGTTHIDANGVYTGTVRTNQLVAGTAKITTAMIENLVVGSNVTMGSGASISWSQVTNQPSIPTVPSYITSTKITSTTIESPSIVGGTITGGSITSNSIINITTDAYIGNNIHLGSTSGTRSIRFNGNNTWIYTSGDGLGISTLGGLAISCAGRPTANGNELAYRTDTSIAVWG